uniref:Importin-5 n=1 Tax=Timema monikensis TaxID=170555 RepID=A0A7R9E7F2_9NEOP|nr:unnamed protein product [Timema monikensis]
MAANQEQFHLLLNTLLSTDNTIRSGAEDTYNNLPVGSKVTYLLAALHNATMSEEAKQMAAVLLRRVFSSEFLEFYPKLPPDDQKVLKEQVLLAVQQEQSESIRKKVCDMAAEVARNLIDDDGNNQWPEFLNFLFQCSNSPLPQMKESALRMFTVGKGRKKIGESVTATLVAVGGTVIVLAIGEIVTDGSLNIDFRAVQVVERVGGATCASAEERYKDQLNREAQQTVVLESVEKQDDDALLKCLIDLSETTPKFLRMQLDAILELCMKIVSNEDMPDSWRHLALEVIVTMSETAPAMLRKVGAKYIPLLVPIILKMMTDIEDEPDWSISDEIVDEDNDSNTVVAESALDRLACGLGGKTIMPLIEQNIPSMLANTDWKYRHAALMALSAVGEGCHKQMETSLPQIMNGVLNFLGDPHPRVRYASCNAIGQMSTDFAPVFEKKFHDRVVPGLLMVLDDNDNPRVQAHAGNPVSLGKVVVASDLQSTSKSTIVRHTKEAAVALGKIFKLKMKEAREPSRTTKQKPNKFELVDNNCLDLSSGLSDLEEVVRLLSEERDFDTSDDPLLEDIKLLKCVCDELQSNDYILVKVPGGKRGKLVEKGTKLVLEQVVTTIASVADTSEEQFVAYYDRLMPCLKYIISNANTEDLKMLRGKAIECVSLIGLAVGAEKFMRDASEVMDMLLKTQTEGGDLPDDDPQTSYLISAWARICKILGKQFEQYLPLVMGPVMKAASMKPEVALLDNDDMQGVEGDLDWQFVSLGEQQNFGIKTSAALYLGDSSYFLRSNGPLVASAMTTAECLEDKASACEMLVCYARELKDGFADYAETVVKLMVPMLKFYFHDGVRTAAAESLPYLLDCGKIKGPEYLQGMWNYIYPELLKAIDTEPENEVLAEHMYSLAKCIETLGNGCLTEAAMAELLKILNKLMLEHFNKAVARQEKRKDEDYDEVVEEQLANEDDEDVYILSKIADIIHSLFLSYKSDFFPYFDQIVNHFVKCLSPEMPWSDHQWALCIFDDVIEYGGPNCVKYQQHFLGPLLSYLSDEKAEVRQAAVYGWGALAQFGGESFAAVCAEAVPRLVKIITDPESRTIENINPTENAISAITKILKYNSSRLNVQELLPHWLSWLPVWEDMDEAPHVYGYLCDLIEANHPLVLGNNHENLPKLIAIIAEAFARDAINVDHTEAKRMISLIRQVQGNENMFQACIGQLSVEQQQALHEVLSGTN